MGPARVAIVVLVFVVSLAVSSSLALSEPADELATRDRLRAAAAELAAVAREPALPPDHAGTVLLEPANRRLAEHSRRVLTSYPGTEAGSTSRTRTSSPGPLCSVPNRRPTPYRTTERRPTKRPTRRRATRNRTYAVDLKSPCAAVFYNAV